MVYKIKILVLGLILWVFFGNMAMAQFAEIGGFGGICSFNGDVNEGDILGNTQAAFGGFVRYNMHPRFAVELGYIQGTLEARDRASKFENIRERNLSFRSSLSEISLIPSFNILPFYPKKASQVFTPYLGAGIAVIIFNPTAKYDGKWVDLQTVGTEGQGLEGYPEPYSLVQVAVPLLLGFKYSIGGRINLAIEVGYRFTFTDYLDDVSTVYVAPKYLDRNGELAVALSNRTEEYTGLPAGNLVGGRRGNSNNNDGYLTLGLRLSFNLYAKKAYKEPKTTGKWNKWF